VHIVCTDEDTAVEVLLPPGQAGDAPQFDALFEAATERVPDAEEVVADKGYDSWAIKGKVLDADMPAHIPSKKTAVSIIVRITCGSMTRTCTFREFARGVC